MISDLSPQVHLQKEVGAVHASQFGLGRCTGRAHVGEWEGERERLGRAELLTGCGDEVDCSE